MHKHNEKSNKERKAKQTGILGLKNTMTEEFNRQLQKQTQPRKRISDLEDGTFEIIQRGKRKKNEKE